MAGPEFTPGEVLVRLAAADKGRASALLARLALTHGYRLLDSIPALRTHRLGVPQGQELMAARALLREPGVLSAGPNYLRRAATIPNDTYYRVYQWNLRQIGMEAAWDITTGDPGVVVAVLDTGVDMQHPDLAKNLLPGYDFVDDDPVPQDDAGHGTFTAGIIAAAGNNGEGIAGMAWHVKVLPLKVLDSSRVGRDSDLARAIVYALEKGARIINISSTGAERTFVLEEAVQFARSRGALVVAAAGNTGDQGNEPTYPAGYPSVLAVGASDRNDRVPSFSQRQPYVSVVAPGVDVPSTTWSGVSPGRYATGSGTSAAAAHVSGLAALLWSLDPSLPVDRVQRLIEETADRPGGLGRDDTYGYGRINAVRALSAVGRPAPRPSSSPVPSPTATPQVAPGAVATPVPLPALGTIPAPATPRLNSTWYFAEGSTRPPFDLWLLLQNPDPFPAETRITYMAGDGRLVEQTVRVPASSRYSIYVNQVLPDADLSIRVESDGNVLAERAMYFGHDGHVSPGTAAASRTWYLAEGSTAPPFDTWVLLHNPDTSPASVLVRFYKEDGSQQEVALTLLPGSRQSIYVNQLFRSPGFATVVHADRPIVVERAMYFGDQIATAAPADGVLPPSRPGDGMGGHGMMAVKAPSRTWYMAGGRTRDGYDTWLLVHNPNPAVATIRATFFVEDGPPITRDFGIRPNARLSVYTNQVLPDAVFGIKVEADVPVVAERATYFADGAGGTASAGVISPALQWFMPEGSTRPPFRQTLALLNPSSSAAGVELTFQPADGGSPTVHRLRLAPSSLATVDVNSLVPDADIATVVVADRPLVVERTMYFAGGRGGTSGPGIAR